MSRSRQIPAVRLPRRTWDVAVVGAGPAGAAAALRAAARGYHVLLLDRDAFPREKVCGDGILPDALSALDRMGLGEAVRGLGRPWDTLQLWSPRRIAADIPGDFLTLPRSELDALLADGAAAAGAVFGHGDVVELDAGNPACTRLRLRGEPDPLEARLVICATGARLHRVRRAGLPTPPRKPQAVAVRRYVRSKTGPEALLVSYDRAVLPGYGWIFPLGEGLFNVGCGLFLGGRKTDLSRAFHRFADSIPAARELLAHGSFVSPLRGAPLRCGLGSPMDARPAPRILVAGEALGTTLPFTGEGVGTALESGDLAGELAADALERDDLSVLLAYPRRLRGRLALRHRGYGRAQAWLSVPPLCDLLAWRAVRSPRFRTTAGRMLSALEDPRSVFSAGALARSFLA
jgi:geranylgeranyl reductase family protein